MSKWFTQRKSGRRVRPEGTFDRPGQRLPGALAAPEISRGQRHEAGMYFAGVPLHDHTSLSSVVTVGVMVTTAPEVAAVP